MSGWHFADRGWFTNDALNLRAEGNRRLVADELMSPNVVFGMHRWFYGGASMDMFAVTSLDEWDAELSRGRPGDNIIVMSLRQVDGEAIVQSGDIASADPPILDAAHIAAIEAYNSSAKDGELLFLRRHSPRPGTVVGACELIDLRDSAWPWQDALKEHAAGGGEMWLFDGELGWRDHERRSFGSEPPESWSAHHGLCLVDGYVPDAQGRVVCGGAY